jgi:hypothetical protein
MKIESAFRVALVSKPAACSLVLGEQTGKLIFRRMALSASISSKCAFASQEGQADFFAFSISFVSIDAIISSTARSVLAHFHRLLALGASLQDNTLVIVDIVLSTRHGEVLRCSEADEKIKNIKLQRK